MKEILKTTTAIMLTVVLCGGLNLAAFSVDGTLGADITATLHRLSS